MSNSYYPIIRDYLKEARQATLTQINQDALPAVQKSSVYRCLKTMVARGQLIKKDQLYSLTEKGTTSQLHLTPGVEPTSTKVIKTQKVSSKEFFNLPPSLLDPKGIFMKLFIQDLLRRGGPENAFDSLGVDKDPTKAYVNMMYNMALLATFSEKGLKALPWWGEVLKLHEYYADRAYKYTAETGKLYDILADNV